MTQTPLNHLSQDLKLAAVIQQLNPVISSRNEDVYYYLLRSIVSQQLSVKAADTIFTRFLNLFENNYPNPQQLAFFDDDTLRAVGLSRQKLTYLRNVADFHLSDNMGHAQLESLTDDEVIRHLTQIKGVGKWTVQMVLMFPLDRPDVFPVDDLGIQNGMKKIYGINKEKKELHTALHKIADQWSPYRTLACKYIWNYFD